MNSNCDDLLRFFKAIVSGQLFRDRRTWRRMQARWHSFPLPLDRAALRQPGWPIEYSLGFMRFRLPGFLTPLRSVPPVLGHTGSTGTWLFHAPKPTCI
jgi:D-alanyl-D-alanine carboxypeptidase